jgi:hypothetical protein
MLLNFLWQITLSNRYTAQIFRQPSYSPQNSPDLPSVCLYTILIFKPIYIFTTNLSI